MAVIVLRVLLEVTDAAGLARKIRACESQALSKNLHIRAVR